MLSTVNIFSSYSKEILALGDWSARGKSTRACVCMYMCMCACVCVWKLPRLIVEPSLTLWF